MIPPLTASGYLPPGVHPASLDEIMDRFGGGSQEREACGQSVQWLVPICRRARISRLLLNGSFVTSRIDPGDVDCVLVPGAGFVAESDATLAIRIGLPYLSIQIVETPEELAYYVEDLFGTDRSGNPKGLVEVIL